MSGANDECFGILLWNCVVKHIDSAREEQFVHSLVGVRGLHLNQALALTNHTVLIKSGIRLKIRRTLFKISLDCDMTGLNGL